MCFLNAYCIPGTKLGPGETDEQKEVGLAVMGPVVWWGDRYMHWRRKWQPTPVFLPGESQGRGSLVGCRLWGRTESDTTEAT